MNKLAWVILGLVLFQQNLPSVRVEENTDSFTLTPQEHSSFARLMTDGWQIIIDWETDGLDLYFWICLPSWDGSIPPEKSQWISRYQGDDMTNYRFQPEIYGEWSFLFYNSNPLPVTVAIHYIILKEKGLPVIAVEESTEPTTLDNFYEKYEIYFVLLGLGIVLFVLYWFRLREPKGTATSRRINKIQNQRRK